MTALAPQEGSGTAPVVETAAGRPAPHGGKSAKGGHALAMLTTTDHKQLGIMYIVTAFTFFAIGGLMALLMRAELFHPGLQFLSNEQFNQLFTMHGTVMLLL
ncbi:MAG: cbb3-type cytochrome c oxidase subunit I, partial [Candidatus Corynebacterium faecigallinarum]